MSQPEDKPPIQSSVVRMRVHYAEVDRMGFLHHSNHLRYFERGREEFCRRRAAGYRELEDAGVLVVVVDVQLSYKTPLRYEDIADLHVHLAEVRHATLTFAYELRRVSDNALAATGRTRHAFVSREGRVLRPPTHVTALLTADESVQRLGELDL
ncbi:MAG: thioesterase family protein [Deltaproteobacteria bacterium]|nr:thioesterase family protein [Deltaproteobacteria bacterium]